MSLKDVKLVFLDLETTGLCPAMGDRIVEIGMVVCRGDCEITRFSRLVNPERAIPAGARRIHGIRDEDVADCAPFRSAAQAVCYALDSAWLVGHNVRFDVGFVAMEIATLGMTAQPLGCLDTCQLAAAVWDLPDYQLGTVARYLGMDASGEHRALADAELCRSVFDHVVAYLGGWNSLRVSDLQVLHSYLPRWPEDSRRFLPGPLYDALTNGREISIRYTSGSGQASERTIRPLTCFPAGRYAYIRAHCNEANEMRTFRTDRIVIG